MRNMLEPKVFLASEIGFKTIDALSTLVQDGLVAPFSTSFSTTRESPFSAAVCTGIFPSKFVVLISTLASMSKLEYPLLFNWLWTSPRLMRSVRTEIPALCRAVCR
jgi:hypothetical protein